jgi:hypothetical protein
LCVVAKKQKNKTKQNKTIFTIHKTKILLARRE